MIIHVKELDLYIAERVKVTLFVMQGPATDEFYDAMPSLRSMVPSSVSSFLSASIHASTQSFASATSALSSRGHSDASQLSGELSRREPSPTC